MNAEAFLKEFTKRLEEDAWGGIEPHWFNPEFLVLEDDQEELSEEQQWAAQLQGYVKEILKEST